MTRRCDRSTISREFDVARSSIVAHPISHRAGRDLALRRAQRPVWAPGVRILVRPPMIRRRSRTSSIVDRAPIAWVRWGGRDREKTAAPPESWVTRRRGLPSPNRDRRAAPCPARLGAGRAVPAVCGRRRPVGRRRSGGTSGSDRPPPGEGGVTAATGDTHRGSPTQAVRSQETSARFARRRGEVRSSEGSDRDGIIAISYTHRTLIDSRCRLQTNSPSPPSTTTTW